MLLLFVYELNQQVVMMSQFDLYSQEIIKNDYHHKTKHYHLLVCIKLKNDKLSK